MHGEPSQHKIDRMHRGSGSPDDAPDVNLLAELVERSDLPDTRHADPAVAAPGWRPARPGDTPGQLAPELAGDLPEGQQSKELSEEIEAAAAWFSRRFFGASSVRRRDREYARQVVEAVAPILVARVRAQTAEDLRPVVEKAIKDWAVMYPIPANGLARGCEERLAERWSEVATAMVFEAWTAREHAGKGLPGHAAALPDVVGTPNHPEAQESRTGDERCSYCKTKDRDECPEEQV